MAGADDLARAREIRAAVYIGEIGMPYEQAFDGNDLFATHLLALVNGEPAGSMRIRWFGEFAHPERLAVLAAYRKKRFGARGVAFALGRAAFDHAAAKGYRHVRGNSREEAVKFWSSFGLDFEPTGQEYIWGESRTLVMAGRLQPPADAITLETDPLVIIRREGRWTHGAHH